MTDNNCCGSNLQKLSKGLFSSRRYSVIGFRTEWNTRNYMCVMIWHIVQCYDMYKKVDGYCIVLGSMIVSFLHAFVYYDCIVIKNPFLELDFILNFIAIVTLLLLLFSISYYPHTIKEDCLFCIHFGLEDDEVKIGVKDRNILSSIEKFFIPVILDNGDILIYVIADGRKNLDEVIKAEEITMFRHVDKEFAFNGNTRKWYLYEDDKKKNSNPLTGFSDL